MGIRRRRRRLTTLMSRLDQRVRAVELRPISLLTSDQVNAAVELGEVTAGPETIVSAAAPYQFKKIQDAYLYPKALTGTEDRVEIYLESDLGVQVGDRIEVSGIHGGNSLDIDVTSDNFTVAYLDTPPWTGRTVGTGSNQITKHDPTQDQLPGVTVTNTYSFKPETLAPQTLSSETRLQTRRKVDTYSITGTTVTLTMNADHKFEADDIIFVDIFAEDSRAYGLDGLFYIDSVTNNTIEYTLTAGVDTPTGDVDVSTADIYVFPVVREWAQDGSIWVDSANNETYYWDGIRWVAYTPGAVAGDGDPPSAPTNFTASSEINFPSGSIARVEVSLSWTAPTTSESGEPITDLAAYLIKWRPGSSGDWKTYTLEDSTATSFVFGEVGTFETNTTYNFELYAKDSGGELSTAATASTTTPTAPATNIGTIRPVEPSISSYMGVLTIEWDGTVENTSNVIQTTPAGLQFLQIHRSLSDGFTPSSSTVVSQVAPVAGQKYVDADVTYGTSYYYRLVLVDGSGTESLPSEQVTGQTTSSVDVQEIANIIAAASITPGTIITGEDIIGLNITGQLIRGNEINGGLIKANTLEADRIIAGSIASRLLTSDVISTSPTDSGARVRLTSVGLEGYSSTTTRTFFLSAADGSLDISGYIQVGGAAADVNNGGTSISGTKITDNTISTSKLIADFIEVGGAASDVNSGTTTISGGKITANSINVNRLIAGTLTGFTIQTGSTGKRVVVSGSSNDISFYNTDGSNSFVLSGSSGSGGIYNANSSVNPLHSFQINGSAIMSINASGIALASGASVNSNLNINGTVVGSSSATFSGGYTGGGTTIGTTGNVYTAATMRANADSASAYAEMNASGAIIRKTVDIDSATFNYAVWDRSSGSLLIGSSTGSDARLKENVLDTTLGLNFINDLRPVEFDFISPGSEMDDGTQFGLIAQELKAVLEAHNVSDNNGVVNMPNLEGNQMEYYSVNYEQLVSPLIKAVQELSQKNADLEARIATLEGN